jgi:hypothetical protein
MAVNDPINPFDSEIDVSSSDTLLQDLSGRIREKQNYDQNFSKYEQRLAPYAYQAPRMSFYDLASELGAGLLATPNTGGASAFIGLGTGFNRASDRMKKAQEENAKAQQQIGLQAAQLAMQDEQKAEEYLHAMGLKQLEIANEPGEHLYLEGPNSVVTNKLLGLEDEVGSDGQISIRDNVKNRATIDKLTNEGWLIKKDPSSVVNIDQTTETKGDQEAAKAQSEFQTKIIEEAGAAGTLQNQIDYAKDLANQITNNGQNPERFGAVPEFLTGIKNVSQGLGLDWMFDTTGLDEQLAIGQVNLGFVMRLVGQTKGAISNKEMQLFQDAAPTLGATYEGYLEMLRYLEIIGMKERSFAEAYMNEKRNFEDKAEESGKRINASKVRDHMDLWSVKWKNENSIFDIYAQETGQSKGDVIARLGSMATGTNTQLRQQAVDFLDGQASTQTPNDNPFNPQTPVLNTLVMQRDEIKRKIDNKEYAENEMEGANALLLQINQRIAKLSN